MGLEQCERAVRRERCAVGLRGCGCVRRVDRLRVALERKQRIEAAPQRRRKITALSQRALERGKRLVVPVQRNAAHALVVQRLQVAGLDRERLVVRSQRFLRSTQLLQRRPDVCI
jgi:hypothetical protein